jgi:hypothetical protein
MDDVMTTIASCTPEGQPRTCPVCGKVTTVDPCLFDGDATCGRCGSLLWPTADCPGNYIRSLQQIYVSALRKIKEVTGCVADENKTTELLGSLTTDAESSVQTLIAELGQNASADDRAKMESILRAASYLARRRSAAR